MKNGTRENTHAHTHTHTASRVTLRHVTFRLVSIVPRSFESIEFTSRTLVVERSSRIRVRNESVFYSNGLLAPPLSYPPIDRIFAVYFLSPCRTPNSLSRHDKTPPRTRPERIVHECYFPPIISISSLVFFFSFPCVRKKVSIQEYRAYPLADKLVEKLIG